MSKIAIPDKAAPPSQVATDTAPSKSVDVREIEYYDDTWDANNYLVCINRHYIFAIRLNDQAPKWEFLRPGSARWDGVHQRVYRNFRADRINRGQLPANLPPPPDSIAPELLISPPPRPPEIFNRADFPNLVKCLHENDGAMPLFLVLIEDRYESSNGDGEFHYLKAIFFSDEEVRSFTASGDAAYVYRVRAGQVWLDGDEIGCEVPCLTFDRFTHGQVLRLADTKLNPPAKSHQQAHELDSSL